MGDVVNLDEHRDTVEIKFMRSGYGTQDRPGRPWRFGEVMRCSPKLAETLIRNGAADLVRD
jgi:hypothetical protein